MHESKGVLTFRLLVLPPLSHVNRPRTRLHSTQRNSRHRLRTLPRRPRSSCSTDPTRMLQDFPYDSTVRRTLKHNHVLLVNPCSVNQLPSSVFILRFRYWHHVCCHGNVEICLWSLSARLVSNIYQAKFTLTSSVFSSTAPATGFLLADSAASRAASTSLSESCLYQSLVCGSTFITGR